MLGKDDKTTTTHSSFVISGLQKVNKQQLLPTYRFTYPSGTVTGKKPPPAARSAFSGCTPGHIRQKFSSRCAARFKTIPSACGKRRSLARFGFSDRTEKNGNKPPECPFLFRTSYADFYEIMFSWRKKTVRITCTFRRFMQKNKMQTNFKYIAIFL